MPFHYCRSLLQPGSIISPGNWGRIVRLVGPRHVEWNREQILERIRQTEFPQLPSRFECVFFCESEAEARYYGYGSARGTPNPMFLYEVEVVDSRARQHEADWKGTGPYDDTEDWARRYWRGEVMPGRGLAPAPLSRERLVVSPLRVLRRLP